MTRIANDLSKRMSIDRYLQRIWYSRSSVGALMLLPLSWLFGIIVAVRAFAFRTRLLPSVRIRAPVIVIGNITVGGTGKTPFTIWLAEQLTARGWRIGVVLRGYGAHSKHWPRIVDAQTSWQEVGDEACVIASRARRAIVVVDPDRVRAAQTAVEQGADIVLSDDGLQHYRLQRDAEILVIDEQRQFGNGKLLPAGPLREPRGRSREVDLRVITRRAEHTKPSTAPLADEPVITVQPRLAVAVNMRTGAQRPLTELRGAPVHAVAAIGHPEAFFQCLRSYGLELREHPYADHAALRSEDIDFKDGAVLMTEKDAVKCRSFADDRHWFVPLELEVSAADTEIVLNLLERIIRYRR
jgi:tetraacyldisaccharide 4'-kinase